MSACFNLKPAVQTAKYRYAKRKGVELRRTFARWQNLFPLPIRSPFAWFPYFAVPSPFSRFNKFAKISRGESCRRPVLNQPALARIFHTSEALSLATRLQPGATIGLGGRTVSTVFGRKREAVKTAHGLRPQVLRRLWDSRHCALNSLSPASSLGAPASRRRDAGAPGEERD